MFAFEPFGPTSLFCCLVPSAILANLAAEYAPSSRGLPRPNESRQKKCGKIRISQSFTIHINNPHDFSSNLQSSNSLMELSICLFIIYMKAPRSTRKPSEVRSFSVYMKLWLLNAWRDARRCVVSQCRRESKWTMNERLLNRRWLHVASSCLPCGWHMDHIDSWWCMQWLGTYRNLTKLHQGTLQLKHEPSCRVRAYRFRLVAFWISFWAAKKEPLTGGIWMQQASNHQSENPVCTS